MGDGVSNGSVVDFGALSGVHFARLFVIAAETDEAGAPLPPHLFLLVDADVSKGRILRELVDTAGDGVDALFGHCVDYPVGAPSRGPRLPDPPPPRGEGGGRHGNTPG